MYKVFSAICVASGLFLASYFQLRQPTRQSALDACVQRCDIIEGDPEVQRQEIVSLEKEAARAIQLGDTTFFRRVYNDDFTGTLSHGQQVDKSRWIQIIQSPKVKYDSFIASNIKVQIFQDTAVATALWSSRRKIKDEVVGNQMRTIHVYISTQRGWQVVSGQTTNLPPEVQQEL